MTNVSFRFEAANGTVAPKFDLDLSQIADVDVLKRVIGANLGVVQPEGTQYVGLWWRPATSSETWG